MTRARRASQARRQQAARQPAAETREHWQLQARQKRRCSVRRSPMTPVQEQPAWRLATPSGERGGVQVRLNE
jgi:hypothetical protein